MESKPQPPRQNTTPAPNRRNRKSNHRVGNYFKWTVGILENRCLWSCQYIHLSDLIDNMAFNLRNNLDLRRSSKLKCILPSQADTRQDTPRHPATSNSFKPINNRENISQNNIFDADEATSITDPEQKETVINLSTAQLSNTEIKLLSRGLTFVPTPKRILNGQKYRLISTILLDVYD